MAEKEPARPKGWDKLRPENDPDGAPQVGFDPAERRNYHVGTSTRPGEKPPICWHGIPDGYSFDEHGVLHPKRGVEPEPAQIVGTPEQPASIPLSGDGEVASG